MTSVIEVPSESIRNVPQWVTVLVLAGPRSSLIGPVSATEPRSSHLALRSNHPGVEPKHWLKRPVVVRLLRPSPHFASRPVQPTTSGSNRPMTARPAVVSAMFVALLVSSSCSRQSAEPAARDSATLASEEIDAGSSSSASTTASVSPPPEVSSPNVEGSQGQAGSERKVTTAADGLVWTAIAVELDDVLNIRAGPDTEEPIVATLTPWQTSVAISQAENGPRSAGSGRWLHVSDQSSDGGWVNARFIVAQPKELTADDRRAITAASQELIRRLVEGPTDAPLDDLLAESGLWVGGIGIYADAPTRWEWIPGSEIRDGAGWRVTRTFNVGDLDEFDCPDCQKSLLDFVGIERLDETTEFLINDLPESNRSGFVDGKLWQAPETFHRMVVFRPSSTFVADDGSTQPFLDWQRAHFVFDWSSGEPKIALINVHGWTP